MPNIARDKHPLSMRIQFELHADLHNDDVCGIKQAEDLLNNVLLRSFAMKESVGGLLDGSPSPLSSYLNDKCVGLFSS